MTGSNWMRDQERLFLLSGTAPRRTTLLVSVFAHVGVLALLFLKHAAPAHISAVKRPDATRHPGVTMYLSLQSKPAQPSVHQAHVSRHPLNAPQSAPRTPSQGSAEQALVQQAKQETAAIMTSLKQRWIYGFAPGPQYQLASQTSGEIPVISEVEVPPHFQQYVIVEVTVDTEGKVAEARIVAGLVDPPIQQKLLSAIREFKYNPAKRDGVPIPSQLDIVVHIPT
jgi:TonB family protein